MAVPPVKALVSALALAASSGAHSQVPFEIEGPITDVNIGQRSISVMGLVIRVPEAAPLTSPTARVNLEDLLGGPLPGRSESGFLGGTAIISGTVQQDGTHEAADVFVEPAENVLRGPLTGISPLRLGRNSSGGGLELRPISDPRIPAGPVMNEFGFAVKVDSLRPGTFAAAGAYYSRNEDVLYYHTLEIQGDAELATPGNQVSIQRAQCRVRGRGRDEITVRGGVTNGTRTPIAAGTQVTLTLAQQVGTRTLAAPVTVALDAPGFGTYNLRATNLTLPAAGCPVAITVSHRSGAATLSTSPEAEVSSR